VWTEGNDLFRSSLMRRAWNLTCSRHKEPSFDPMIALTTNSKVVIMLCMAMIPLAQPQGHLKLEHRLSIGLMHDREKSAQANITNGLEGIESTRAGCCHG